MPLKDPKARSEYHKRYMRERYASDSVFRQKHRGNVKLAQERTRERAAALIKQFRAAGCVVCKERLDCCLVAHHLDPTKKDFNVGEATSGRIHEARVEKELVKCVCLCHNCHSKVHAGLVSLE